MKICKDVDLKELCSNMKDDGNYYTEEEGSKYLEINKKTRKINQVGCSSTIIFWLMTGIAEKG